jgi:hypothetical protein
MSQRSIRNLLAVLALTSQDTQAATFCVDTTTALRDALTAAASNGQADYIKIVEGFYAAPNAGMVAFGYDSTEPNNLIIEGGYVAGTNPPCSVNSLRANQTVLSGSNARRALDVYVTATSTISVRNLLLRDGYSAGTGGGMSMAGSATFAGTFNIERVIFDSNSSQRFAGGLDLSLFEGRANVVGNLFRNNQCGQAFCAMTMTVNSTDTSTLRALVGANTVVNNICSPITVNMCVNAGMEYGGSARAAFYNNAFAFNQGADIWITSGSLVNVLNNNVLALAGDPPATFVDNLALAAPGFVNPANNNYRLRLDSPLRNAGTSGYLLPNVDLDGNVRIADGVPDIGAFEREGVLFADGFE